MPGYLVTIMSVTGLLLVLPVLGAAHSGVRGVAFVLLALLAVIPFSDVALAFVNYWITHWFGPKALPAMELHGGVPSSLRTMIVMPTMLTARDEIEEQIERLEVHYLANQDGDLYFALLSDWRD